MKADVHDSREVERAKTIQSRLHTPGINMLSATLA